MTIPSFQERRLGVLSNPLSGRNRRYLRKMRALLARHPQVLHREVSTLAETAAALHELARAGVNVVAINGGDGSVQAVLTVLFRQQPFATPPRLAVLAGGTLNMTAGDVGIGGHPVRALRRLLAWSQAGVGAGGCVRRPVIRVDDGADREPLFGLFFSAAGLFQATLAWAELCRHPPLPGLRGNLATIYLVGTLLPRLLLGRKVFPPSRVAIRIDDRAEQASCCLVLLVTTLERLVLGIRPYWDAAPRPLHLTTVAHSPRHLLRAAPALLRGRPNHTLRPEFGYASFNADQVRLRLDGGFTLDGQTYTTPPGRPVILSAGGSVDFLRL